MNLKNTLSALLVAFALFGFAGCGKSGGQHTEGDGHDHAAESTGHDEHGGEGHDEHGEEVVRLTDAQLEEAGVVIEPLSSGVITTHVTLPAEVGLNQDAVLHVTPRVPGIVTEVFVYLGDDIAAGTPLTVIESPQLGEAKIAYLQAIQARAIAEGELERQRTISENTASLLDLLRDEPEVDVLRTTASDLRIGENKGRLISAYAKLNAARANYTRERDLRLKNLSTEADLLAAQETYNSSQADYFGAFEDIDFTYRLRLQEAEQAASVTASTVDNAERRLHLLGLSDEQVANVAQEPDVNVARYELRAPIGGRIVAKHVTPGEKVNDEEPIYTIANLDSVWLNISVYSEYAGLISEGQSVVIHADKRTASGVVDYVSAVVSEGTRTVSARVVVDNTDGSWKPGEFVTARVETGETRAARVVPLEAIQTFEGQSVVFVQDEDGIEPKPVTLGRRNDLMVELLGDDIALGTPIVVTNSFLMKAELGKSAAGHDH
jgi:cobalt-zinc-cadmium efflux system membrane fusion protein